MPLHPVVTVSEGLATDQTIISNLFESMMLETSIQSVVSVGIPVARTTATLVSDLALPGGQFPVFTLTGMDLSFDSSETGFSITSGTITDVFWELQPGYTVTFSDLSLSGTLVQQAATDERDGLTGAMETMLYGLDWEYNGNSVSENLSDVALTNDGEAADLAGNNRINTFFGRDTVFAGAGDDTVNGGRQNDMIDGGTGNDRLRGNDGFDIIYGRGGDDHIEGNYGYDTLYGGIGNDTLLGKTGDDVIWAGDGDDLGQGGSGRDTIRGEAGNDTLIGFGGRDKLFGGRDDDFLDGRLHNDTLIGEAGNDTLIGGDGNDYLRGGEGMDEFVFSFDGDAEYDKIVDFDVLSDQIVLLDGVGFNLGQNSFGAYVEYGDKIIEITGVRLDQLQAENIAITNSDDYFGIG